MGPEGRAGKPPRRRSALRMPAERARSGRCQESGDEVPRAVTVSCANYRAEDLAERAALTERCAAAWAKGRRARAPTSGRRARREHAGGGLAVATGRTRPRPVRRETRSQRTGHPSCSRARDKPPSGMLMRLPGCDVHPCREASSCSSCGHASRDALLPPHRDDAEPVLLIDAPRAAAMAGRAAEVARNRVVPGAAAPRSRPRFRVATWLRWSPRPHSRRWRRTR
jgi:hypothetical protein